VAVTRLAVAVLGAVALLVTGTAASAHGNALRWPYSYLDPVNDASGGPDVTKVETGGDLAAGLIGLRLTVENYVANSGFDIYVDADHDRATGTQGFEYLLVSEGDTWTWNATDGADGWKRAPLAPTSSATHDGNLFAFQLSTVDLGGTAYFNFAIVTFTIEPGNADPQVLTAKDLAPDRGGFDFSLNAIANAAHPPPLIKPLATKPKHPQAAKQFTVDYVVTDKETLLPASTAKVAVTMTIGGKKLPAATSFRDGVLVSRALMPAHARGRLLVVRVLAGIGNQETRRQDGFRIG
jgi:hypothetical protein